MLGLGFALTNLKVVLVFGFQGMKAREILHGHMERIIQEKMERHPVDGEYHDAFDHMLASAKELGQELSTQELKVRQARGRSQSQTGWATHLTVH